MVKIDDDNKWESIKCKTYIYVIISWRNGAILPGSFASLQSARHFCLCIKGANHLIRIMKCTPFHHGSGGLFGLALLYACSNNTAPNVCVCVCVDKAQVAIVTFALANLHVQECCCLFSIFFSFYM